MRVVGTGTGTPPGGAGPSCTTTSSRCCAATTTTISPRCARVAGRVLGGGRPDGDADDLVAAGAVVLRAQDDEIRWTVMADPEGNEFCVFAPK